MEPASSRPAEASDVPQIRTVIARALADDPMIRWLIPDAAPPDQAVSPSSSPPKSNDW